MIGSRNDQILVERKRIGAVNEPYLSVVEVNLMLGVVIVGRNIERCVYSAELEVSPLDEAGDVGASSHQGNSERPGEVYGDTQVIEMGDDMGTDEGAGDCYVGNEGLYDEGIADGDRAPVGAGLNEVRMSEFRLGTLSQHEILPGRIGGKRNCMIAEILCEEERSVGCGRVIYGGELLLILGLRI